VSEREKDEEAEFIELAARDVITGEEGGEVMEAATVEAFS